MSSASVSPYGVVYAADIGSTRGTRAASGFGWFRIGPREGPESGRCIMALANAIVADLKLGRSVALGFEAPLTIPVPVDHQRLSYGRANEGNRSFAAPPGLAVTTLCLHQSAWLLTELRNRLGPSANAVVFSHDATSWPPKQQTLFCWEAFVSGDGHSADHVADARSAAKAFLICEHDLLGQSTIRAERPLSAIGAAALWSGWLANVDALKTESVVIRPVPPNCRSR